MSGQPSALRLVTSVDGRRRTTSRRRRPYSLLAEAARRLAASLDYGVTLREVARLSVTHLGDWCMLHVPEGEDTGLASRLVLAHRTAWMEALLYAGWQRAAEPTLPEGHPLAIVSRTRQPVLLAAPDGAVHECLAENSAQVRVLLAVGVESVMAVPLVAHGVYLGGLMLVSADPSRRYGTDDLAWAQALADYFSLAIFNAQVFRESMLTVQLQNQLLEPTCSVLLDVVTNLRDHARRLGQSVTNGSPPDRAQLAEHFAFVDAVSSRMGDLVHQMRLAGVQPLGEPEHLAGQALHP